MFGLGTSPVEFSVCFAKSNKAGLYSRQRGDGRGAVKHPEGHWQQQAKGQKGEDPGEQHPHQAEPEADHDEIQSAQDKGILFDISLMHGGDAVLGDHGLLHARGTQGHDLRNAVDHGQPQRQADDGQIEEPGGQHPQQAQPGTDKDKVQSAHQAARSAGLDGGNRRLIAHGSIPFCEYIRGIEEGGSDIKQLVLELIEKNEMKLSRLDN